MRARTLSLGLGLLIGTAGPLVAQAHSHDHTSPYAAFSEREIKALSPEEVQGLLTGAGLGMALPGELNGYPGPRHVLDMAPMLDLSTEQQTAIRIIFEGMEKRARVLGEMIVTLERELDRQFAEATITEEELARLVAEIADANGELRLVHLRAHLELRPLLTDAQLSRYRQARGYGG